MKSQRVSLLAVMFSPEVHSRSRRFHRRCGRGWVTGSPGGKSMRGLRRGGGPARQIAAARSSHGWQRGDTLAPFTWHRTGR